MWYATAGGDNNVPYQKKKYCPLHSFEIWFKLDVRWMNEWTLSTQHNGWRIGLWRVSIDMFFSLSRVSGIRWESHPNSYNQKENSKLYHCNYGNNHWRQHIYVFLLLFWMPFYDHPNYITQCKCSDIFPCAIIFFAAFFFSRAKKKQQQQMPKKVKNLHHQHQLESAWKRPVVIKSDGYAGCALRHWILCTFIWTKTGITKKWRKIHKIKICVMMIATKGVFIATTRKC